MRGTERETGRERERESNYSRVFWRELFYPLKIESRQAFPLQCIMALCALLLSNFLWHSGEVRLA